MATHSVQEKAVECCVYSIKTLTSLHIDFSQFLFIYTVVSLRSVLLGYILPKVKNCRLTQERQFQTLWLIILKTNIIRHNCFYPILMYYWNE